MAKSNKILDKRSRQLQHALRTWARPIKPENDERIPENKRKRNKRSKK